MANRLEHARDALRVELAGEHRLIPRRRHEGHRREVVELVRPDFVDHADERELIEQSAGLIVIRSSRMLNAPEVRRARAAHGADDFVSFREEQFREVGSVLPVIPVIMARLDMVNLRILA
jgi:hypothetical protein